MSIKMMILIAAVVLAVAIGTACGTGVVTCEAPIVMDRDGR